MSAGSVPERSDGAAGGWSSCSDRTTLRSNKVLANTTPTTTALQAGQRTIDGDDAERTKILASKPLSFETSLTQILSAFSGMPSPYNRP